MFTYFIIQIPLNIFFDIKYYIDCVHLLFGTMLELKLESYEIAYHYSQNSYGIQSFQYF